MRFHYRIEFLERCNVFQRRFHLLRSLPLCNLLRLRRSLLLPLPSTALIAAALLALVLRSLITLRIAVVDRL